MLANLQTMQNYLAFHSLDTFGELVTCITQSKLAEFLRLFPAEDVQAARDQAAPPPSE